MALVLARKPREAVFIDVDPTGGRQVVEVRVGRLSAQNVRLLFDADPKYVRFVRGELLKSEGEGAA
mgnify:CR=1 FL=1